MDGADPRPLTPVLVGPTAVGKTAVAAALAALTPITVISADARQVYRGLDIGTAKPDRALRARVPHIGLDLVDPGERYSAGRFARDAAGWLDEIRAREAPLEPGRRERLRGWTARLPGADLARWAGRLDARFQAGGRQRAARAIEVALLTGQALSWWQREARASGVMRPWYIHLTLPREALRTRIAARVDAMLAAGLVEEVRGVLAQGVPPDAAGLDGVGYREVVAQLTNGTRLTAAELREAIAAATRRYAKRQETWFRNQLREPGAGSREPGIWTLDAIETPELLARRIHERWSSLTPDSRLPAPR